MVSAKLVHRIEDHWEQIGAKAVRLVRNSRDMPRIAAAPESEITDACRRVLRNLGDWLVSGADPEIASHFERIGADRNRNGIPLSEAIRALQLMKDATIGFIQDQGPLDNTVELCAEEELENQLGRFFDLLVFHLARGFESGGAAPARVMAATSGQRT